MIFRLDICVFLLPWRTYLQVDLI